MKTIIYAAYGSNLHPVRLTANDRCPSAEFRGTSVINGRRLIFRKRSTDGSVKCDAEYTENTTEKLWLALFDISESEVAALDKAEGLGRGYYKDTISLKLNRKDIVATIYLADKYSRVIDKPYEWYKQMILLGAEYHGLPSDYVQAIQSIQSKKDQCSARSRRNWSIIDQMKTANNTCKVHRKPTRMYNN